MFSYISLQCWPSHPGRLRWLALAALLGCAHHQNAEQSAAQFRELAQHEAALSRAEAERAKLVSDQASECAPPMHEATARVCDEASALCAASEGLRDRDAETRCLRGRDACRAGREHARVRCR